MKQLLAELGIEIVKAEGAELICTCPFCEKPKLYVNIESGLWQCWRGCDQGNALTLARHLSNASDKDIFEKLNRIGLAFTDKRQAYVNDPQKKPRVASTDLQPMSEQDWQRLCQAKDLDRSHVEALEAFRHYGGMIAFIPAFDPEDRDHACGWIRVHLDGKLIETKYGSQKYPVEEGSQPGLIGLRTMTGEGPLVFCEGWKDMIAARALGFDSLTNSQGVKTWRESWGSMFQDREVWVCFDRDEAGTKSAPVIADHIKRYAK